MVSEQPIEEFQAAFWAAKRAMTEATEAALARHGVRAGQQFVLQCLWADDGLTPGEIARRLRLAAPTVTRATSRMEAAGLLVRRPDSGDGRLVRLFLTDRGRALQLVVQRERNRLTKRALASLAHSERAALVGYLTEIRRNLTLSRSPGDGGT